MDTRRDQTARSITGQGTSGGDVHPGIRPGARSQQGTGRAAVPVRSNGDEARPAAAEAPQRIGPIIIRPPSPAELAATTERANASKGGLRPFRPGLVVVMAFCERDGHLAIKMLQLCRDLDGRLDRTLVLVPDSNTNPTAISRVQAVAQVAWTDVRVVPAPIPSDQPWPMGANGCWSHVARYMYDFGASIGRRSWLWIEPDCVPLKSGWLTTIEEAYTQRGKPFMGHVVPTGLNHLTGVAVYPWNTLTLAPKALTSPFTPFDVALSEELRRANMFADSVAQANDLIQHIWCIRDDGRPTNIPGGRTLSVKSVAELARYVLPTHVLVHRCKDGSAIEAVRSCRGVIPECTGARYELDIEADAGGHRALAERAGFDEGDVEVEADFEPVPEDEPQPEQKAEPEVKQAEAAEEKEEAPQDDPGPVRKPVTEEKEEAPQPKPVQARTPPSRRRRRRRQRKYMLSRSTDGVVLRRRMGRPARDPVKAAAEAPRRTLWPFDDSAQSRTRVVDLVYVTYLRRERRPATGMDVSDLDWLKLSLRSVKRWVSGIRHIHVAVPQEETGLLAGVSEAEGVKVHGYTDERARSKLCQMVALCKSDGLTDADFIMHVDPDCIFRRPFDPRAQMFAGEKIALFAKKWPKPADIEVLRHDASVWIEPTRRALGIEPQINTMAMFPMLYHRSTYNVLRRHVERFTKTGFEEYVMSQKPDFPQGFCEFNALGIAAVADQSDTYLALEIGPLQNSPWLTQYWSHGGLTPQVLHEIEQHLK